MRNLYYIELVYPKWINGKGKYTASSKAEKDVFAILQNFGCKRICITRHFINRFFGGIEVVAKLVWALSKCPKDSFVFIQYPMVNIKLFSKLNCLLKQYHIIAIVHDIPTYRFAYLYSFKKKEVQTLNSFHSVILHTKSMERRLIEDGVNVHTAILGAFDYLLPSGQCIQHKENHIVFAGALQKSIFLKELYQVAAERFHYNLYGANIPDIQINENIHYKGCFSPDNVTSIEGEWGLLWDGDSIESCGGQFGEYLKWIAPHKFSLYVACGLKIIVWEQSAMADLVVQSGLGIAIASLHEIPSKIAALSPQQISDMERNVTNLSWKIRNGKMLGNTLIQLNL